MACSTAFRTPTARKSTPRQLGQRAENTSSACLCGAAGGSGRRVAETLTGDSEFRLIVSGAIVTAGFAGCLDLLRRPQIRLGGAHLASFARNLPFVALG